MDLVTRDGQTVSVPDDKVGEAVASGELGIPKGPTVKVVGDTGTVGSLSADDAVKAFQAGTVKRLASDEEFRAAEIENKYGGLGGAALATGAGLARGATVGLSDAAATGLAGLVGGEEAKASVAGHLSGAKEAHPYLSTGGEVAGMVAPALLTGGAGGVSTLGRVARIASVPSRGVMALGEATGAAVGRGLAGAAEMGVAGKTLSRAAQLGAQGMLEGSLYGAGNEISEAALGNVDLTAEKLIAGAKHGAIMGGVAGAALGGGSVLAEAAAQKMATKLEPLMQKAFGSAGIEEAMQAAAEKSAFKAAGARKADYTKVINRHGEEGIERIGRTALEELPGASGKEFWRMNLQDMSDAAEKVNASWGAKIGGALRSMDARFARANVVEGELLGAVGKAERSAADQVAGVVANDTGAAARTGIVDANKIIDRVQTEVIDKLKANPFQQGVGKQVDEMFAPFREQFDGGYVGLEKLHSIRSGLDDMIYRNEKAGSVVVEEMRQARSIIEQELEKAGDAAAKELGGDFLSQYKLAKQKYADTKVLKDMSANSLAAEGANRFISPSDYGMGFLGVAMQTGGPAAIAMGILSGSVNHFLRKQGRQILASGLDKASTLFSAQRMAAEVDGKIGAAIDSFVSSGTAKAGKAPSAAMAYLGDTRGLTGYAQKSETVRGFATNPAAASDKIASSLGGIANHAPQLAGAISTKATQAAAYLESKSPPSGRVGSLQPQFDKLTVSKQEAIRWARHAAVVNDPLSVLDDLQHHRLTFEAVDTLKSTSPQLFDQIREQVMDKVAHATKPLSYAQRLQLGLLFDFPADPSMQPDFGKSIQSTYQAAEGGPPASGTQKKDGAGGAPHVRAAPLTILKSIATGSQKGMTR